MSKPELLLVLIRNLFPSLPSQSQSRSFSTPQRRSRSTSKPSFSPLRSTVTTSNTRLRCCHSFSSSSPSSLSPPLKSSPWRPSTPALPSMVRRSTPLVKHSISVSMVQILTAHPRSIQTAPALLIPLSLVHWVPCGCVLPIFLRHIVRNWSGLLSRMSQMLTSWYRLRFQAVNRPSFDLKAQLDIHKLTLHPSLLVLIVVVSSMWLSILTARRMSIFSLGRLLMDRPVSLSSSHIYHHLLSPSSSFPWYFQLLLPPFVTLLLVKSILEMLMFIYRRHSRLPGCPILHGEHRDIHNLCQNSRVQPHGLCWAAGLGGYDLAKPGSLWGMAVCLRGVIPISSLGWDWDFYVIRSESVSFIWQ